MKRISPIVLCLLAGCAVDPPPRDWADRALLLHERGPPVVTALELGGGEPTTVFEVPSLGFAYELDSHPMSRQLAMAYTPPPKAAEDGWDRSFIGLLDDGGVVQPVACELGADTWCFYPQWSADGSHLWFVGTGEGYASEGEHVLSRVRIADGVEEQLVPWATEPAVSPAGEVMAWVAVDSDSGVRSLVLGTSEGEALRTLVSSESLGDLGRPVFSPDGAMLYFVVLVDDPSESALHGLHDRPGDWWRIDLDSDEVEQVSFSGTIQYDGVLGGGDDPWLMMATREGVVRLDTATGEEVVELQTREVRALTWCPSLTSR